MPKRGRPTSYTDAIADEICERLADGESLRAICEDEHMPAESTVRTWALKDEPDKPWSGFFARYARARMVQAHRMFDDILVIADDGSGDRFVDDEGNVRIDNDVIQRSRLRVDTRKWWLSKALPKLYGDRVAMEHSGPNGGPIETRELSDDELKKRATELRNRLLATTPSNGTNGNGKH